MFEATKAFYNNRKSKTGWKVSALILILLERRSNGTLSFCVYRKPTHSDSYLKADSHHPASQTQSVLYTLANRAMKICDYEHLDQEKKHIRDVLNQNGYTNRRINKAFEKVERRIEATQKESDAPVPVNNNKGCVYLPYVRSTTEKLVKLFKKFDVKSVLCPQNQLKKMLCTNLKDKIPFSAPGVYEIPCFNCDTKYIGESGRPLRTRLKEHKSYLENSKPEKSAVAEHALTLDHKIDFESSRLIAPINFKSLRLNREALEINSSTHELMNRKNEGGLPVSTIYRPLLEDIKKKKMMKKKRKDTRLLTATSMVAAD
jgi:hypothetical protein